jgi:hypothetical protein
MTRHLGWLALALMACAGSKDDEGDTDLDTDTVPVDTDVEDTDTDVVETGETGDTEIVETDTEVPDTDGEHVVLHGQLWCILPDTDTDLDTDTDTDAGPPPEGVPATPGFVKITIVQPWTCVPLGPCNENTNVEVLAETTLDDQGRFDLDFQTYSYGTDELYVYTNNDIGVCGNGYQYTQNKLTDYPDWTKIVIDVDSIWH